MPRFVILEHDHPETHWDFMLEVGPTLKTWRLAQPPLRPTDTIAALPLPDHRLDYLEYEGPVSGNRGSVRRWDMGTYENLGGELGPTFRIHLLGSRVQGTAEMEETAGGWKLRLDSDGDH